MTHPFNSVREDASISSRPEHRFRPFSVEWAHQPEIELLAWSRANDGDDADWASVIPVVTSHAAVTRDLETVEVVASVDDVALVERPVSSDESHVSDLSGFRPDDDTHVTALHEAGHALVAVAFGVKVESASIIPDQDSGGRVTVKLPPRPTERDCQPHSLVIESHARRWLAGDRAVRLLDPQMETSHGGPSSDYTMAVSLLEAVCDSDELVEAELDRHCQAVDDYFARDDVRQQLASFASLLISERQLDAASIAGVLSDGDCGARNFDTGERCTGPWHWAGDHAVLRGLSPIGPIWGCWDGFGAPDRTPKSKRTKRHRNVIRILEPHIYPPPPIYRGIKLADLPVFGRSASPTRQQAKALQRKLTAGARNGDALLLAGSGDCSASDRATHERRCGPLINDNEDGLWCAFCGFEQRSNRAKRQRWVYYLSISTYDGDSEVEPVPEHPAFMFCEAQLAAKYLLFLRQSSPEDFSGGIKRVPLVGDLESIKPTTT